jgi:antitoxin component YwqK of YwqJK toxin-antitoxin module
MQDKIQYNEIDQKNGYCEKYWGNDSLLYKVHYINGNLFGYYLFDWHGRVDKEYYAR